MSNTRTPLQSVVVFRDGKQLSPPLNIPFEFTAEEIEQIEAVNPDALSTLAVVDVTKKSEADL